MTPGAELMASRPRLGFLGTGPVGRKRLTALVRECAGTVVAVADPDEGAAQSAARIAAGASVLTGLGEMLELELDGLVIATPSALHADQAITALEQGVAVFLQKPLARNGREAELVLSAAQRAGRPFGVDLGHKHTAGARVMRREIREGRVGEVFAVSLAFHRADGPEKQWLTDRRLSGGGCMIDLGIHLVDLLLWMLGDELRVDAVSLLRRGRPLAAADSEVEDFAAVQLRAGAGTAVQLSCSWFLPAGCACVFECTVYGTGGSLSLTNVAGSFHDFRLDWRDHSRAETLVASPDDWGGSALCAWARQLQRGAGFEPGEAARLRALSHTIDLIYAGGGLSL
jgi:predicted dehydrogenase